MADPKDCKLLYNLIRSESGYFNFVEALEARNRALLDCLDNSIEINARERVHEKRAEDQHKIFADQTRNLVAAAKTALEETVKYSDDLSESISNRFDGLPSPESKIRKSSST